MREVNTSSLIPQCILTGYYKIWVAAEQYFVKQYQPAVVEIMKNRNKKWFYKLN